MRPRLDPTERSDPVLNENERTVPRREPPVFVTDASGYIGGRVVPRLLEAGHAVRCLARSPRKLADRPRATDPRVEIVAGDAADEEGLARAMEGCGAAYYLIHSMIAVGSEYRTRDRELAQGFSRSAHRAGLERILYLGGLGQTVLEFRILPGDGPSSGCRLVQTARFKPRGLAGLAYWYAVLPFHGFVFRNMLRGIAREAEQEASRRGASFTLSDPSGRGRPRHVRLRGAEDREAAAPEDGSAREGGGAPG